MTGWTRSGNFPTLNPMQATVGGGGADAFITKVGDGPPPNVVVNGTPQNDTLVLRDRGGNSTFFEVLLNGQQQAHGSWSALAGVPLNGLASNDTIQIERFGQ